MGDHAHKYTRQKASTAGNGKRKVTMDIKTLHFSATHFFYSLS